MKRYYFHVQGGKGIWTPSRFRRVRRQLSWKRHRNAFEVQTGTRSAYEKVSRRLQDLEGSCRFLKRYLGALKRSRHGELLLNGREVIMSYCRAGLDGSDVYIYTNGDQIICVDCDTRLSCAEHMLQHIADEGHRIPKYAEHRLRIEATLDYCNRFKSPHLQKVANLLGPLDVRWSAP